jgi:hypothetical protein
LTEPTTSQKKSSGADGLTTAGKVRKDQQNLNPLKHNCGQSAPTNLTNPERGLTQLTRAPNDKPSLLA